MLSDVSDFLGRHLGRENHPRVVSPLRNIVDIWSDVIKLYVQGQNHGIQGQGRWHKEVAYWLSNDMKIDFKRSRGHMPQCPITDYADADDHFGAISVSLVAGDGL